MTRLEEQRQAVSYALENQDQRISAVEEQLSTSRKHVEEQLQQVEKVEDRVKEIVREELQGLSAGERCLTAIPTTFPDRHSGVVAKPYPHKWKNVMGHLSYAIRKHRTHK
ncbi:unnamed protein product [Callosobruchus maculatus]|uniref:Uncharacterized protein n=1 Tax=Callosobruchus maculatus TaxID=64391 RepID=A0A653D8W4_CALMS|nr:unnamed protein product [Callosobruchus maculatus]